MVDIFLIDGIGPFFRGYSKYRINWSKIPFNALQLASDERCRRFEQIAGDMAAFAKRVSGVGYNSVSLDDVAHLAPDPWHDEATNAAIEIYRQEFRVLFAILQRYRLSVYLTMDVLSFSAGLRNEIGNCPCKAIACMKRQIRTIFDDFPEVKGIILRIGECDGNDVKGEFRSELIIRSARAANRLLHELLPVFEERRRLLILRNWTVGAYTVGDFIWHRRTTSRVLRGIDSPWFILSMKYGESDFFRYLPINTNFFRIKVRKIIEMQARREYEGCGEYPSFVGWDCQDYARQLEAADNMAGISVWCQTGGWLPFRRLSYLDDGGLWNELNSFVILKVFRERLTVEEAVARYCEGTSLDPASLIELLRLSDQVVKELLYIPEVARQKLFFRRVRVPPLFSVYWNSIFINHSVRMVLLTLVGDRESCVRDGYQALARIGRMKAIAAELELPVADLQFMEDTFRILAIAREYYFQPNTDEVRRRLRKAKRSYKAAYPRVQRYRYRIKTDYRPLPLSLRHLRLLQALLLRRKRGYRLFDYLFTLHLLGALYRILVWIRPSLVPKFARKHAMGIDTIFR